jgi:SAM-dependent methyltransferase
VPIEDLTRRARALAHSAKSAVQRALAPTEPLPTGASPEPAPGSSDADGIGATAGTRFDDRSNYKGTWSALATTHDDAEFWVAGYTDEPQLEITGNHTVDILREYVGVKPTDDFLEIGCGIGRVGKVLAPQVKSWTGADISAGMIEVAKRRTADLPNVRFQELSGVGLSEFADESFDVVYCTVVFMHLFEWDRYAYVKEARRVLRPGGRCHFDNVDITSSHGKQFFADSAAYPLDSRPPQIGMVSSGDELRCYGEWAGYENIEIHRFDDAWVSLNATKPL